MPASAAKKTSVAEEMETRTPAIMPNRVTLAETKRNQFRVLVPIGTNPDDVLDQQFWEHSSKAFSAGDDVTILTDDFSWRMDCMVVGAGKNFAVLAKLAFYDLDADVDVPEFNNDYKVEFKGHHHKWRVVRKGVVLKDGFATKAIASRYAQQHESKTTT